MIENFEDKSIINFRVAGYANMLWVTMQSSFHFLLKNMKINIWLPICKQIILLNSRIIIPHFLNELQFGCISILFLVLQHMLVTSGTNLANSVKKMVANLKWNTLLLRQHFAEILGNALNVFVVNYQKASKKEIWKSFTFSSITKWTWKVKSMFYEDSEFHLFVICYTICLTYYYVKLSSA
jgi:hypothetical protein